MKHKRQHIVPRCYLSEWVEAVTPPGQTAALWKFAKDGSGDHSSALPPDAWKDSDEQETLQRPERINPDELVVLGQPELFDDSDF